MPLVALLNGERLEAHRLDAAAWADLKSTYTSAGLTMPCGNPGIPKTLGTTQFFAHRPGADCGIHTAPETAEHLALKAAIADAATAAGWTATLEYPAADRSWIADVLLERGEEKLVVEVQWSGQTYEEFLYRQNRYEAAGYDGVWFVHERNRVTSTGVPALVVAGTIDAGFTAEIIHHPAQEAQQTPLAEVVGHLLRDELADRADIRVTNLRVTTAMIKCYKDDCKKWMTFWYVSGASLETRCGYQLTLLGNEDYDLWAPERIEPSVQDHVAQAINASDRPRAGIFAFRNSKTAGHPYMAVTCPHCGAMQGDAFIIDGIGRYTDFTIPGKVPLTVSENAHRLRHLCVNRDRGACAHAVGTAEPGLFPREDDQWWISDEPIGYHSQPLPEKKRKPLYTPPAPNERKMPRFQ